MVVKSQFDDSLRCLLSAYRVELLPRGTAPLVSISGGQDSIFLAWTVFQFQKERSLSPIWLYHNHLWHSESFLHGRHSLRLAFIFGWPALYALPFHSILHEASASDYRRKSRRRLCIFYGTNEVLIGHTKTDRMESLLFNLFRGSLNRMPLPEQDVFPFETSSASLFDLEGSYLAWSPPIFPPSGCGALRTHRL
jgi:tRNA(Ile)-lysidine synthase